jgi:hypothetical protein
MKQVTESNTIQYILVYSGAVITNTIFTCTIYFKMPKKYAIHERKYITPLQHITVTQLVVHGYNLETGPVVPKVFSADPTGHATSSHRIRGYISVMATLITF